MKVTYVEGDMAKVGLGLSTKHQGLLMSRHISLVFHMAASVSFQGTLLGTMKTNALALMWLYSTTVFAGSGDGMVECYVKILLHRVRKQTSKSETLKGLTVSFSWVLFTQSHPGGNLRTAVHQAGKVLW